MSSTRPSPDRFLAVGILIRGGARRRSEPSARRFDESLTWDAGLRTALLDAGQLGAWQAQVDRLLVAEGAGHLVHDLPVRADGRVATIASRPWRLDPIPVVIDTETFQWLSSAVIERMDALEEVLGDLYGARQLVRDGVVPADLLALERPLPAGGGRSLRRPGALADDVRRRHRARPPTASGGSCRTSPTRRPGIGYALLDRSVMSRTSAELLATSGIASLARFPGQLRRALAASSPAPSPRTVLFSGGIDHPSYIDHSYLAVQLGVHLVEGADLVVRQGRLWLRTLDGLEPIDVVYRRLEDPTSIRSRPVRSAHRRGRDPGPAAGRQVRRHRARQRARRRCRRGHDARRPCGRPRRAIWRASSCGCPSSTATRPPLATTPLFDGSQIRAGEVVLRMFAVHDGRTGSVMPGGSGRVLAPGDDPSLPTACVAKDVWVVGTTLTPFIAAALPQVDFAPIGADACGRRAVLDEPCVRAGGGDGPHDRGDQLADGAGPRPRVARRRTLVDPDATDRAWRSGACVAADEPTSRAAELHRLSWR